MSWPEFLFLYTLTAVALLALRRSLFINNWGKLLRVVGYLLPTCFISDYLAETRRFWSFASPPWATLLGVPLENLLFTVASIILALVLYLETQRFFRKYKHRSNS